MASQETQQQSYGIKKKLSYSLPSPGLFDLERGPEPGNLSPSFTRGSDDIPGSGASDKPLNSENGSHGHGIGHSISNVLHRTFTQQFRAADGGEKDSGFRGLFKRGGQASKNWKNRQSTLYDYFCCTVIIWLTVDMFLNRHGCRAGRIRRYYHVPILRVHWYSSRKDTSR